MRLLAVAAAAAALGFVCPAFADVQVNARSSGSSEDYTPAIVVAKPDTLNVSGADLHVAIDSVKLVERIGPERTHAVLTLSLSTTSTRAVEVFLPIELPREARATGMIVNLGGERFPGVAMSTTDAWHSYNTDRPASIDPALLTLYGITETTQSLEVRAFPITKAHAATIAIDLDLPHGTAIKVLSGISPQIKKTKIKKDDEQAWLSVDRNVSLYAGPASTKIYAFIEPHDMVADPKAGEDHVELTLDAAQRVVATHARKLRTCFAGERTRTKRLVGSAALGFEVGKTGRVSDLDVTLRDHPDAVRSCIRKQVEAWKFPVTDDVTRVAFTAGVVLP
jgi:hypothetical protein